MARYTAEITLNEFDDRNLAAIYNLIAGVFRQAREEGDQTIWIDIESGKSLADIADAKWQDTNE